MHYVMPSILTRVDTKAGSLTPQSSWRNSIITDARRSLFAQSGDGFSGGYGLPHAEVQRFGQDVEQVLSPS